jgi:hypothetical protein
MVRADTADLAPDSHDRFDARAIINRAIASATIDSFGGTTFGVPANGLVQSPVPARGVTRDGSSR